MSLFTAPSTQQTLSQYQVNFEFSPSSNIFYKNIEPTPNFINLTNKYSSIPLFQVYYSFLLFLLKRNLLLLNQEIPNTPYSINLTNGYQTIPIDIERNADTPILHNNFNNLEYANQVKDENIPTENLQLQISDELSKNSFLFSKSNRVVILQDDSKQKSEIRKTHTVENPWAMVVCKPEKHNEDSNKDFIESKLSKESSNYKNLRTDEFIEFKPKRYLKCLENEKPIDFNFTVETDNKLSYLQGNNKSICLLFNFSFLN